MTAVSLLNQALTQINDAFTNQGIILTQQNEDLVNNIFDKDREITYLSTEIEKKELAIAALDDDEVLMNSQINTVNLEIAELNAKVTQLQKQLETLNNFRQSIIAALDI
eukprot:TRINITY_DN259_c0_g1_i1.p1 TRINITY_DN259_c0_g1~~TRINITY_DN259_c0_g1_i1.p1  ORF type:complete len:119 (+),score=43.18 TRINITY_DN259_c0_g1_i1:32-358(+)